MFVLLLAVSSTEQRDPHAGRVLVAPVRGRSDVAEAVDVALHDAITALFARRKDVKLIARSSRDAIITMLIARDDQAGVGLPCATLACDEALARVMPAGVVLSTEVKENGATIEVELALAHLHEFRPLARRVTTTKAKLNVDVAMAASQLVSEMFPTPKSVPPQRDVLRENLVWSQSTPIPFGDESEVAHAYQCELRLDAIACEPIWQTPAALRIDMEDILDVMAERDGFIVVTEATRWHVHWLTSERDDRSLELQRYRAERIMAKWVRAIHVASGLRSISPIIAPSSALPE